MEEPVDLNPAIPANSDPLLEKHYKEPYNIYRRAKLILLSSAFKHHDRFLQMQIPDRFLLIEKIERACLNFSIEKAKEYNIQTKWSVEMYQDLYSIICARIASNITQDNTVKNSYLANAIFDNQLKISDLPRLSSQELYPDKYREVIYKLEQSKNVQKTVRTTAMYKCRRCHKSECTIENRYNRSLDEGVNLTITCMSCGFEWNG